MNFAIIQQAAAQDAGSQGLFQRLGFLPLMVGMGLLFYFMMIRPQNKARKAMEERLSKLKAGDEVLLSSGLYATIDRVEDKNLYLKLGTAIVKARRNAVVALASEPAPDQQR